MLFCEYHTYESAKSNSLQLLKIVKVFQVLIKKTNFGKMLKMSVMHKIPQCFVTTQEIVFRGPNKNMKILNDTQ